MLRIIYVAASLIILTQKSVANVPVYDFEEKPASFDDGHCDFLKPDLSREDCNAYWNGEQPPVLLISLDGFRPEYLERTFVNQEGSVASTLKCLSGRGVSAPFMMPSYPTLTFPNHYSIVTGLYPESHEIVGNAFYDPELKAEFSIRNPGARNHKWWRNGEPIWRTVRKEGKKSATYFWPGSDVEYNEAEKRSPNFFYRYDRNMPFKERVRQVIEWLDRPSTERPSLITLYFEEPDSTGHKDGPSSSTVAEKVSLVDNHIRSLLDGLVALNISSCVNIIVVSDHGMAESPNRKQLVDLEQLTPDLLNNSLTLFGPITAIYPKSDSQEQGERILVALTCNDENMRAFQKWELPYRMHFSKSPRVPPIILDFNIGWRGVFREERYNGSGAHGWDNLYPEMQAIFVAYGPSFRSNVETKPFENIELYNLMCALLNVTPAENNGTWGALHHLLVDPPTFPERYNGEYPEMIRILQMPSNIEIVTTKSCGALSNSTSIELVELKIGHWNMADDSQTERILLHAPLGVPICRKYWNLDTSTEEDQALLVNKDYLQIFDTKRGVPVMSTYTIMDVKTQNSVSGQMWVEDPRIEAGMNGGCQTIANSNMSSHDTLLSLFPKEFATHESDIWLDTNVAILPKRMGGIVQTMTKLLARAYMNKGPLNVVTGIVSEPSVTVFYVVLSCSADFTQGEWNLTYCPIEQRDVQAFLLPSKQWMRSQECTTHEDFIAFNVASLKDVENFTGYDFFPDLSAEEKAQLLSRTVLGSSLVVQPSRSRVNA